MAINTGFSCIPSIQQSEGGGGALIREGGGGGHLFDIMAWLLRGGRVFGVGRFLECGCLLEEKPVYKNEYIKH